MEPAEASTAADPTLTPGSGVGPRSLASHPPPRPLWQLFHAPGFRRLFLAQTVSRWGDTFNAVALVILVFRLTGSGLRVAGTVAFEIAPVLLLGFVAGAIVDRHPRRRIMITADLGRAAICLALVAFGDNLAVIYAAAFGLSVGTVFFNPAATSLMPTVVDPDDIVSANSALWSAAVISRPRRQGPVAALVVSPKGFASSAPTAS
jgi:MFS family permease